MADETGYVVIVVPQGGFQEIGRAPEAREHGAAIDEVLPDNAEGQFIALPARTYETAKAKAVKVSVESQPVRKTEPLFKFGEAVSDAVASGEKDAES